MEQRPFVHLGRFLLTAAAVGLALWLPAPAAAGFGGEEHAATSKSESVLSGIRVGIRPVGTQLPLGTPISEIIKLYGPPTSQEDAVVPDGAGGTRFYKWEWPGLRMSVATYFFYCPGPDGPNACSPEANRPDAPRTMVESAPAYIDVWGDAPRGELGVTGRGLALGSTLDRQKALYGDRYEVSFVGSDGVTHIQLQWEDGAFLMIDYTPNGRCNHIRLTARDR